MAIFGAAVSIYFIATHNWDDFTVKYAALVALGRTLQGFLPTLPGHRLHPNVVGGILAMMVPFSAAVSWQAIKERPLALGSNWLVNLRGDAAGLIA